MNMFGSVLSQCIGAVACLVIWEVDVNGLGAPQVIVGWAVLCVCFQFAHILQSE